MANRKSTAASATPAAPVTPEPMARRRNPLQQSPAWAAPKTSDYDLEAQIRAEKFAKMEAETAKVRVICRTRGTTFESTHTELEANLLVVDVVSSSKSLFFASSDSDELTEILPKDCSQLSLTVALPISQIDDLVDNLN
jgi:hypothetical protein